MKAIDVFLTFDGNCKEAMQFYQGCLGGELTVPAEALEVAKTLPSGNERTVHMRLQTEGGLLMGADTMAGAPPNTLGNNFAVALDCSSLEELERCFARLSEGGKVTMELGEMFWGARFGMLRDKYGVSWMLNFMLPKVMVLGFE